MNPIHMAVLTVVVGAMPLLGHAAVMLSDNWSLQDIAKVPAGDTGDAISKVGYTPANWHKATVPGTVLTSLVNDGVYPEPLYGENNRPDKIPESLCRTSYWYRLETVVPADFAGNRAWLNFAGINYTADVWVNGRQAGTIRGAFARGIFDITDFVKPGEKAAIAVKIYPPPHPGNPQEQTVALGAGRNGGELMQDGPTFGCTVGWDWIPAMRDRDMGIWQKVTLSTTGPVRIDNPSVSSDLPLPRTDSADLTLFTSVRNATDQIITGNLKGSYEGGTFSVPVTLQPHERKEVTVTPAQAAQLRMNAPKLWWPNTYGEANLYTMHVSFDVAGTQSDTRDVTFGVRKITYQVTPDLPITSSENLTLIVNGVPVFCKGGCWGMDEAMKRIPAEVLDAKVRFHKEANYTMIRNWVGQSTSEDFYAACDKYGILVWDEMFQANGSDGPQVGGVPRAEDAPETLAWREDVIGMYEDNVREKVLRYRSHPSIALWCGRNESYPAPPEIADFLTRMTAELDPARFYQANSGDGGGVRSGGPYSWRPPSAFFGSAAPMATTAGAGSGRAPGRGGGGLGGLGGTGLGGLGGPGSLEPFKTELGCVSIPTLEAIKAWLPEKDWYDVNDDWASHDLCSGAQSGNTFPAAMSARYGAIAVRDLPDFVRKSQLAMYETYRAMYEGRQARLFSPCTGVLTWMSNPSQPSFVWQVYSYDLEPLAALFGAKKACEPVHIQMNQNDWHIMVVNTMPAARTDLTATIRVYNMDGTLQSEKTTPAIAKALTAIDWGAVEFPETLTPVHFVKLELRDSQGKLISDNFYWRTTAVLLPGTAPAAGSVFGAGGAVSPASRGGGGTGGGMGTNGFTGGLGGGRGTATRAEDFSPLQSLPTAELQITLNRRDAKGRVLIDATVSNPTRTPALQAHLQLRNGRTNQRLLPAFYSDNFVSLLPGESRTLTLEAPAADLGGDVALVTLDGWNVTVADKSFGTAQVRLNKEAFVGPKAAATSTPATN